MVGWYLGRVKYRAAYAANNNDRAVAAQNGKPGASAHSSHDSLYSTGTPHHRVIMLLSHHVIFSQCDKIIMTSIISQNVITYFCHGIIILSLSLLDLHIFPGIIFGAQGEALIGTMVFFNRNLEDGTWPRRRPVTPWTVGICTHFKSIYLDFGFLDFCFWGFLAISQIFSIN